MSRPLRIEYERKSEHKSIIVASNGFGELRTRTAKQSGSPVYSAAYSRDAARRITEAEHTVDGDTATWDYTYDWS